MWSLACPLTFKKKNHCLGVRNVIEDKQHSLKPETCVAKHKKKKRKNIEFVTVRLEVTVKLLKQSGKCSARSYGEK